MVAIDTVFVKSPYNMGTVFLGKFPIPNTFIAAMMVNTNIQVSGFQSVYNREVFMLYYYPVGKLDCCCCKKNNVQIDGAHPAYAVYSHNKGDIDYHYSKLFFKTLICSQCYDNLDPSITRYNYSCPFRVTYGSPHYCRLLANRDIYFNVRCIARRWRKRAKESSVRKEALEKLRPFIMHWASKPNGPLYKLHLQKVERNGFFI